VFSYTTLLHPDMVGWLPDFLLLIKGAGSYKRGETTDLPAVTAPDVPGGTGRQPNSDRGCPPIAVPISVAQVSAVAPAIADCADTGMVLLVFRFGSDGCVQTAKVVPDERGKPADGRAWLYQGTNVTDPDIIRCVEREATLAQLNPFLKEVFKVQFPFKLGSSAKF